MNTNKGSTSFKLMFILLFLSVAGNLYLMNLVDSNLVITQSETISSNDLHLQTLVSIDHKIMTIKEQELKNVVKNIDKFLNIDITTISNEQEYMQGLDIAKLALLKVKRWDSVYDYWLYIWKFLIITKLLYIIGILITIVMIVTCISLHYNKS